MAAATAVITAILPLLFTFPVRSLPGRRPSNIFVYVVPYHTTIVSAVPGKVARSAAFVASVTS